MNRGATAVPFPELTSVRRLRESREGLSVGRICPHCHGPMGQNAECRACRASKTQEGGPGSGPRKGSSVAQKAYHFNDTSGASKSGLSKAVKSASRLRDKGFKFTMTSGKESVYDHSDGRRASVDHKTGKVSMSNHKDADKNVADMHNRQKAYQDWQNR